jgi:hypothetical protein
MSASIKISQLQTASMTSQSDTFMIVQNGSNKKLTLQTLLANMNSNFIVNSNLEVMNFTVNGLQSNLLCTNATTNSVGILTSNPDQAKLQVIGDIRVGGNIVTSRDVTVFAVGATDSGGTGYKKVTVTVATAITGIFVAGDIIEITGCNIAAMNGLKVIGDNDNTSFTYNITNATVTTGLVTNPPPGTVTAKKTEYQPGVYKLSKEQILHTSTGGTQNITASYSSTGLNVEGSCQFTLSNTGGEGQEKYIYLKSIVNSSGKATISNVNGLGFNRIQLTTEGQAVSLMYDGDKWVCLGVNGAGVDQVII